MSVSTTNSPALTDSKTLEEVVNCLTENIPIKTQGECELGIESSYRMKNQCRIKTTIKNPT